MFSFLSDKNVRRLLAYVGVFYLCTVGALASNSFFADGDVWYHAASGRALLDGGWGARADFSAFSQTIIPEFFFNAYISYQTALALFVKWLGFAGGTKTMSVIGYLSVSTLFFFILRSLKDNRAALLGAALFMSSVFLSRISQDKGQAMGVIFFILWLWFFLRKKRTAQFLTQLAYPFVHMSFVMPIALLAAQGGLALAGSLWSRFKKTKEPLHWLAEYDWKSLGATVAGLVLGLALHPEKAYFFKFYTLQISNVIFGVGRVVSVGGEWYPLDFFIFIFTQSLAALVLALLTGSYAAAKERSFHPWSLLAMSWVAWAATLWQSRQAEVAVPLIALCVIFLYVADKVRHEAFLSKTFGNALPYAQGILLSLLMGSVFLNQWLFSIGLGLRHVGPHTMDAAFAYVRDNVPEREPLFHPSIMEGNALWYEFGNRNPLIVGLDNQYFGAKNPEKALLWQNISSGKASTVSIMRDFGARTVIIGTGNNYDEFSQRLFSDGCFDLKIYEKEIKIWQAKAVLPENCRW